MMHLPAWARIVAVVLCFIGSCKVQALTEWLPFSGRGAPSEVKVYGLSDDGRYVLFYAGQYGVVVDNIAAPGSSGLYVYDRQTDHYKPINIGAKGIVAVSGWSASVTPDLRYILFYGGILDRVTGDITSVPMKLRSYEMTVSDILSDDGRYVIEFVQDDAQNHIYTDISVYDTVAKTSAPLIAQPAWDAILNINRHMSIVVSKSLNYVFLADPAGSGQNGFYRYDRSAEHLEKLSLPTGGMSKIKYQSALWISDDGLSVVYDLKNINGEDKDQYRLIRYRLDTHVIDYISGSSVLSVNSLDDGWHVMGDAFVPGSEQSQLVWLDMHSDQRVVMSVDSGGVPLRDANASSSQWNPSFSAGWPEAVSRNGKMVFGGTYDPQGTLHAPEPDPTAGDQSYTVHRFYTEPEPSAVALSQQGAVLPEQPYSGERWQPVFRVQAESATRETWLRLPLSEDWMLEKWPSACHISSRWLDCRAGNMRAGEQRDFPLTLAFYRPGTVHMEAHIYQSGIDLITPNDLSWQADVQVLPHPLHAWLTQPPWIEPAVQGKRPFSKRIQLDEGVPILQGDALRVGHVASDALNGADGLSTVPFWQDDRGNIWPASNADSSWSLGVRIRPLLRLDQADGTAAWFYGRFSKSVEVAMRVAGSESAYGGQQGSGSELPVSSSGSRLEPQDSVGNRQGTSAEPAQRSQAAQRSGGGGMLLGGVLLPWLFWRSRYRVTTGV